MTHIKILKDEEVIFEGDFEQAELLQERKVTPLYKLGGVGPFTLAPSLFQKITIEGILAPRPNAEIMTMER